MNEIDQYQRGALEDACRAKGHEMLTIESYTRQVVAGFKFCYEVVLADGMAHVEMWHRPGDAPAECVKFELK